MAFNSLHFKIKDHFEYKYFLNLFDFNVQVAQYEQFRKGNNDDEPRWSQNKNWNKEKEKNILFIEETSAQDRSNTSDEKEDSADEAEVYIERRARLGRSDMDVDAFTSDDEMK